MAVFSEVECVPFEEKSKKIGLRHFGVSVLPRAQPPGGLSSALKQGPLKAVPRPGCPLLPKEGSPWAGVSPPDLPGSAIA
jgi:hypothetical protein